MNHRFSFALLAIVALVVGACTATPNDSTEDTGSGGIIEGTHWVLRSMDVDGSLTIVPDTLYADADFGALRVEGFSGCNGYNAVALTNGRSIRVSHWGPSTLMSCGEEADAFEARYRELLSESRYFTAREGTLRIFGPQLQSLLIFDAAPRNPLLGVWNVASYESAPNSQSAPLEGTQLSATFGLFRVSGSGGCNTYDGTYGTNGSIFGIGRLATTLLACPDDVMAQETAFLEALQGFGQIQQRAQAVNLLSFDGQLVVALVRPGSTDDATEPSALPTASESASPSPSATASPTQSPSPTPTQAATPTPTRAPTPTPSPGPTLTPPPSVPPTAECSPDLEDPLTATIVYPSSWSVVTDPAVPACQFFNPQPVVVPPDPANLQTAITVTFDPDSTYADAVADATDPATWTDITTAQITVAGLPATVVEATSTLDDGPVPNGSASFAYYVDLGDAGVAVFQTIGEPADAAFDEQSIVLTIMAALSTITTG
jgi:heat shock protein HslJ